MDEDSRISHKAIRVIDVHLCCSMLKVESRPEQPEVDSGKRGSIKTYNLNTLSPFVSLGELLKSLNDWPSVLRCLLNIFSLYTVIKLCILSALHFENDRVADQIRQASTSAVRVNSRCINSSAVDPLASSDLFKQSVRLQNRIFYLGSLIPSYRGITSIGYLLAAMSIICLNFLGPIWIRRRRPGINIYGFIKDKDAERRKFVQDMEALIESLFVCQRKQIAGRTTFHTYNPKGGLLLPRASFRSLSHAKRDGCEFQNKRNQAAIDDSLIIVGERRLQHLIEPAHLTDWWHRKLCRGSTKLSLMGFSLSLAFGSIFLHSMMIIEAVRHHEYRLRSFECSAMDESLSPLHSAPLRMRPLESNFQIAAYRNYDGSVANYVRLILLELQLYLKWRELSTYLELIYIMVLGSYSLILYIGIYMAKYASKTLWLNQISQQVKTCIDSMIDEVKKGGIRELTLSAERPKGRHNDILRLMTLAYLDFELFRRQQKGYQALVNFLIAQMILLITPLMMITYSTLSVLRKEDTYITFIVVFYVVSFLNIYMITSAIRTNQVLKLMKNISRLVAFSTEISLERSLVANLWSSQALNYGETLSLFAPKLFGISISFSRIVSLNVYVLAFCAFALRK